MSVIHYYQIGLTYWYSLFKITFSIIVVSKAAISIRIINFLICFCSFDSCCPILKKENVTKNGYIVLSCLIK